MRKFYVYVHTCTVNGKRYVGCTTRVKPELRWKEGRGYQNNDHFYRAILKYGWTNFQHEVFEVDSAEEMYRKEVELISFYHSNDPRYGYNNSVGGEKSALGCKHSEESRKKMSESHKGKSLGEEHRKKLSEAQKKRYLDHPEIRSKISETQKGRPHKPCSEEQRKKISETLKKRWSDLEVRKKQSEAQKNRPRIKIKLPDGTILEMAKQNLTRNYIKKGKKFEYLSY